MAMIFLNHFIMSEKFLLTMAAILPQNSDHGKQGTT
jgi:hypothetical protein